MTIPIEYQRASIEFERFMVHARDAAGLATTNMAWNMVAGVFFAFRRRLTVEDALRFAGVLPPVLRALFLDGWDFRAQPVPVGSRESLLRDVRSLRPFDAVLRELPIEATAFWTVETEGP